MLLGKDRSSVYRNVFTNLNTKTSSDFIVALHDIGKHIDIEMMIKINPVYVLEYMNWETSSNSNIKYISDLFDNLNLNQQKEVKIAYNYLCSMFLNDYDLNDIFPLDNENVLTFKIFKELTCKRDYCNFN